MSTDPAWQARRRFAALDGVRGLCILAVLWHHGPLAAGMAQSGAQIWGRGFLGVDFFFVLSGFLITTLLLREEGSRGRFSLRDFYLRRALRILPAYWLVLALVLHDPRGHDLARRLLSGRWMGLALLALILALAALLPADLRGLPNLVLHLAMTACLAALVLNETSPLARALTFAPLARLGEVSYGVYLYHLFALVLVAKLVPEDGWLTLGLYAALSWALAEISFRSLETWVRRFRPATPQ